MLLNWIKKNRSLALKITGVNFLVMTFVLLFWSQPKAVVGESTKASANVARMESRVERKVSSGSSSASVMRAYKENQEKQLRIALIIMALLGAGFLVYGFIDKAKKEE